MSRGWTLILYGPPGQAARRLELTPLRLLGMLLMAACLAAGATGLGWQLGKLSALFGF